MCNMLTDRPAKTGYLYLGFERDATGRSLLRDCERRAPLIVQQALYFDEELPDMPCVYILSSGGPIVEGDRYEQHIVLREGAYAHISTGAATKIAEMRGGCAHMSQHIDLEHDAYLEYLPEPTIPCRRSRYYASTTVRMAPSATLCYADTYLSGRRYYQTGERFAYEVLSLEFRVERPDGEVLFREHQVIEPSRFSPQQLGVVADYDVVGSVLLLTPMEHARIVERQTASFIDTKQRLVAGVTYLPNDCGLLYRILGDDTGRVKRLIRQFCSQVRMQLKGRPLFEEFPWR
jgi:urease accessory protein